MIIYSYQDKDDVHVAKDKEDCCMFCESELLH